LNKKDKKTPLHTLDMKGNCRREWSVSVWGEGEGVFETRGKGTAGVYGVSESVGGVWGAVCEGEPAGVE